MDFIEKYKGIIQFGKAYKIMLENDLHASGSADRELTKNMIRLCSETKDYLYKDFTPCSVNYIKDSRPKLESIVDKVIKESKNNEEIVLAIAKYCSKLSDKVINNDSAEMKFGGTEEEIIDRGSEWCTDISRVGCIMYQIAGFPSRIINTFNVSQAYSGHVINEVYRDNIWGVVDATNCIAYYKCGKKPATSWEIMNRIDSLAGLNSSGQPVNIDFDQFKGVAISNYLISDQQKYKYTISGVNDYYSRIIEASSNGWPSGLKWLYGEDIE